MIYGGSHYHINVYVHYVYSEYFCIHKSLVTAFYFLLLFFSSVDRSAWVEEDEEGRCPILRTFAPSSPLRGSLEVLPDYESS